MMLNLSNHPFEKWVGMQKQRSLDLFGKVIDMDFPDIDPTSDKETVSRLASLFVDKIKRQNPEAVHIMGELTFVFCLVTLLKKEGITCIASTTERKVEERNGQKISQFQFIRFREY